MIFNFPFKIVEPKEGETRLIRVFALLPKRIREEIIWLENYYILQAYIVTRYELTIDGKPKGFANGKWVNISKRKKQNG